MSKKGIAFRLDGGATTLSGVYQDKMRELPVNFAQAEMKRASHVNWDGERKMWVATRASDGSFLCEHELRDECVRLEVEILSRELSRNKKDLALAS
jgi:hypothetical protein